MKNLLITTIGSYNHSEIWLKDYPNYDSILIDYNKTPTFKYPGIYNRLRDNPQLLEYDYYWMPDEDVSLSTEDINKLFDLMSRYDLELAQPSIEDSSKSFPSFKCFIHKAGMRIIYTNFIEIMCPCFSRSALLKCLETFNKSQSGYGLDIVWPKLINDNGSNIAILNDIIALHTRKVRSGNLYNSLTQKRIRPSSERKRLMAEYGISNLDIKIHANRPYSEHT